MNSAHLFVSVLVSLVVEAQIPLQCANIESLTARVCCPVPDISDAGPCGVNLGRGSCRPVAIPDSEFDPNQTDVRVNWPIQYFNSTCVCGERFGGVDCGECSYAYNDGGECKQKTVRPRKSIAELTDEDWKEYVAVLLRAQASPSRYMVVTVNFTTDYQTLLNSMTQPSVYHMFVWVHYTASNTPGIENINDMAHQGPGFPTWHRHFILWFERELQVMLGDHLFRLHYWNWLDPDQRDVPFTIHRLGALVDTIVTGDIVDGNWSLICWSDKTNFTAPYDICDPRLLSESRLIRCPNASLCERNNSVWPSYADYQFSLSLGHYDVSPYSANVKCTEESYRNYMEGFLNERDGDCGDDPMCVAVGNNEKSTLKLHNVIHTVLGLGNITSQLTFLETGVMVDGSASPNDPIFINHHSMVDCMLEEWIQKYQIGEEAYPTSKRIKKGHKATDYIVPFIPVYQQREMLVPADKFGYSCSIPGSSVSFHTHSTIVMLTSVVTLFLFYSKFVL